MLSNVVDVDFEAMTVSLTRAGEAIVLFDFKAAFPSISHTYLLKVLRHIGMPSHAMNLVEALYDCNRCIIACGGSTFEGFPIKAGIRQGCPLSPLLFAVVADLLLRKLSRNFPNELIRSFADDTAMVVKDWWRVSADIASVFGEFGSISGLVLNLPKTVLIPLWPSTMEVVRAQMARILPNWSAVSVARWALYLGFATGPEKMDHSWDRALNKFIQRISTWEWTSLGLQYAATAYNTYVMSVLAFVAQLENPPEQVLKAERKALRAAARGPGNWAKPSDLWFLKEAFGGTVSFASVAISAWAAQVRVFEWEARATGGLKAKQRAKNLSDTEGTGEYMGRRTLWASWYARSHVRVLTRAVQSMEDLGITIFDVSNTLARGATQPWNSRRTVAIKRGFQRQVRSHLLERMCPDAEDRIRHKLSRWHFDGNPRVNACRATRRLHILQSLVPPRVTAAVFSTLWNRWTTCRKFQMRTSTLSRCVLGCPGQAEDSLEHYGRCSVVLDFACRRLHLRFGCRDALPYWMMVLPGDSALCTDTQVRTAVLVYAVYRATNTLRPRASTRCHVNEPLDTSSDTDDSNSSSSRSSCSSSPDLASENVAAATTTKVADELLSQFVHEAVTGHAAATKVIDECWLSATRGNPRPRRS